MYFCRNWTETSQKQIFYFYLMSNLNQACIFWELLNGYPKVSPGKHFSFIGQHSGVAISRRQLDTPPQEVNLTREGLWAFFWCIPSQSPLIITAKGVHLKQWTIHVHENSDVLVITKAYAPKTENNICSLYMKTLISLSLQRCTQCHTASQMNDIWICVYN